MKYHWDSQACQYATTGEPGIHLEQCSLPGRNGPTVIDCLLYRDDDGQLIGIFNHFNEGNWFEQAGRCALFVHPDRQRRGRTGSSLEGDPDSLSGRAKLSPVNAPVGSQKG